MKIKKVLVSLMAIAVFITTFAVQGISYAATAENPIYLGITEIMTRNTPNIGYSIGDPSANGSTQESLVAAKIWNIEKYTSATSADPTQINAFCVKAGVGFSDTKKRATYDLFYDMKTKREEIKAQNKVLESIVEGTIPYGEGTVSKYNALLAAIDMLYLPGNSSSTDKEQLLTNIITYASQPENGYTDYVELMEAYPMTDDDIVAAEQAALWYFTNYYKQDTSAQEYAETTEHNTKYDKTTSTDWIYYTLNGTTYDNLSDYTPNGLQPQYDAGQARSVQIEVLYNYIIKNAKANASKYSNTSTSTGAPAKVNTTSLSYEESGDNYIIGPINITETEGNTIPYTIDFVVKNEGTAINNYTLLNASKQQVASGTTVKNLVGSNFYLSIPKTSATNISVDITINYKDTKMTLWASSTNNQEQPVVIPEKESKNVKKTLTFSPESPKPFDLALRKYITKVNGTNVTNTRVPNIDESSLQTGTTATYKHRKDPVLVETEDVVTYKITIYNEGEKAGRATQIIDQLPTGLEFKRVVSGNFEEVQIDGGPNNNKLYLNRKSSNEDNLPAYTSGNLASETIEIECRVVATPDSKNKKILTNVAWISAAIDEDGNRIENLGDDRDSEPATQPDVNKDNMSNYKGDSNNKSTLNDKDYYYKGQQDDDDFEKLVLEPEVFDLKLIKSITEVNGKAVTERLKSIDVSKLNVASNAETTATYKMDKNPVSVAKGDIVTYRLRVYNEGTLDGYAKEITEDIPEGLEFVWSMKEDAELEADTTLTEAEKEAVRFNQQYLWGNFKYDDSREKIIQISTDYLSKEQEKTVGENLLTAFGKNDGTKTANDLDSKEVFVKMKVVSDNVTGVTIRNEACVSKDSDKDGNDIDDRDSTPEEWKKENDTKYYDDDDKWPVYKEDDEDYDNIILKPFDLALRKFIIAVSADEKIDNDEYLKDSNGQYTRAPKVDTSKLNTLDNNGKMITTATYNHTKEPVKVKKNDIVVYMIRVYNEGEIDGYAAEIKDHLPEYLEFVDGEYNEQYGWTVSEDGRTVTTTYLANQKINAAKAIPLMVGGLGQDIGGGYELSYKEVPIMCKVKDTAKVNEKITNIADITKYLDEDKKPVNDRDSEEDNVDLPDDKDLPKYKDDETGDYIPGQQDDDDFEKVIIPRFDLALRKQIVNIHNNYKNQDKAYNDRFAKLDNSKVNTIYNYYDVESNIPTVVENDVVTYSIRVYNEGEVDGTATWVTDRLPSGLEYLPENETNKKYGWKAYKESTKDSEKAIKIGEKYYEEVEFDSKEIYMYATEYLKDSVIKAYTGTGEADYKEVYMATRVKAKYEVADETEYKLRNIAEIGDDDNDDDDSTPGDESKWQDQDDLDIEDLKLVEFDLALRKWVTEAIVIENGQTTVTPTGHQPYDDPEQVVKVELNRRKLNQVVVKFRYSIRVINEGDIPGYAKEVTDYVPQGLKFLAEDNQGWTDEGNNVISTRLLENTLLKPGEYADVEVVLTWQNDQNNMGVMVNTAEISEDDNDYGVPDRDSTPDNKKPGEDDIDDAPVMLSITTGQVRIYFILGFTVLITIAGGVVLIKKYVL